MHLAKGASVCPSDVLRTPVLAIWEPWPSRSPSQVMARSLWRSRSWIPPLPC